MSINRSNHLSYSLKSKSAQKLIIKSKPINTPGLKAKKQKTKLLFLIATVALTFGNFLFIRFCNRRCCNFVFNIKASTWLPAHVIQVWKIIFNSTFPYSDIMYIIKVVSHTLSYSNSLINPFIYVFIGAKFRNHIYLEFNRLFCFLCFYSRKSRSSTRNSMIVRNNKASEFSLKIYESNNHESKRMLNSANRRITKM